MILRNGSLLLIYLGYGYCLLVPEEIPSLLMQFYGGLPTIKKGTNSTVGFSFRLGPNADFQVLFELGPRRNTQPLKPNTGNMGSGSKREVELESAKEDGLLKQQKSVWTGLTPDVHNDIVNQLRQLYKPQKVNQNNS